MLVDTLKNAPELPSRLEGRLPTAWLWLVPAVVWLVARPYFGVRHDGILYLAQALRPTQPWLNQDFFFLHGSQDDYSIFAKVFGGLIGRIGIPALELGGVLVANLSFLVACVVLMRALQFRPWSMWFGLVALAAFPHIYDGTYTFGFAEPFLTARSLAEPICLFALAAVVTGRVWLSAILLALGMAFHPLVAVPTAGLVWAWLCLQHRAWIALGAVGVAGIVGAAFAGIKPFSGLLATYDPEWWGVIRERNPQVVLAQWRSQGWQLVGFDIAAVAAVAWITTGRLRAFSAVVAAASAVMLLVTAVGSDALANVLVASLQVWRILWVTHLLALLVLPILLVKVWRMQPYGPLLALSIVTCAIGVVWSAGWAFLLWLGLVGWLQKSGIAISRGLHRSMLVATVMVAIGVCVQIGRGNFMSLDSGSSLSLLIAALGTPVPLLLLGALAFWLGTRLPRPHLAVAGFVVAAGVIALLNWDMRSPWARFVESGMTREHPFARHMAHNDEVYWHGDLRAGWLLLHRPHYYTPEQAAGLMFNRGTYEEEQRRNPTIRGLHIQAELCEFLEGLNGKKDDTCTPTPDLVEDLCVTQPKLGYAVFQRKVGPGVIDQWTFEAPRADLRRTYYLYDCKRIRGGASK